MYTCANCTVLACANNEPEKKKSQQKQDQRAPYQFDDKTATEMMIEPG